MRKFLPYIFIFIVIFGFFTPTHFAFGQVDPTAGDGAYQAGGTHSTGDVTGANKSSCGVTNPGACAKDVLAFLMNFIMVVMGWVLWLSGTLLNLVLEYTIIHLKDNLEGMTGITIVWRTVRDLVNIAFIFILLYEGIKLIISQSDTTKAKNVVVGIVVTAILINFSVFFTKIIIDASNIVTIGFYKSIAQSALTQTVNINTTSTTGSTTPMAINGGISGAFTNALKVGNLLSSDNIKNLAGNDALKIFIIGLMGSMLFLILAFIFFAISAMFFIRYVAFLILLVLSPIGFLGFGIPQLKKTQEEWWNALTSQAMFAPVYMILTWITLVLISSPGFIASTDKGNWGQVATGLNGQADPSSVAIIINFGIIIALAIFSLTQAKSISFKGAKQIGEYTGKLTSFAGGALMGSTAMLGRNIVGRTGNSLANNESLKEKASQSGIGGWAARQGLKLSDKAAGATFDVRNTSAVKSVTKQLGINVGEVGKDQNFRKILANRADRAEKFTEKLKPSDDASNTFKKEREDYLKSEEYKKSDIYTKAEREKAENDTRRKEIEREKAEKVKIEKELTNLEAQREKAFGSEREEITSRIEAKRKEVETHDTKIKEVEDYIKQNNKAQEEREKYEKVEKEKTLYARRADSYADTITNPGWLGKFANAINTAKLGDRLTKSDRKFISDKIKKKAKSKTDEQIITEAAARIEKKKKDQEDKSGGEVKKEEGKPEEKPKTT